MTDRRVFPVPAAPQKAGLSDRHLGGRRHPHRQLPRAGEGGGPALRLPRGHKGTDRPRAARRRLPAGAPSGRGSPLWALVAACDCLVLRPRQRLSTNRDSTGSALGAQGAEMRRAAGAGGSLLFRGAPRPLGDRAGLAVQGGAHAHDVGNVADRVRADERG